MQIYFPQPAGYLSANLAVGLGAAHCQRSRQLVSHGFIRKKRVGADPEAVGKRVFCSNRHRHTGCGRTTQLYLAGKRGWAMAPLRGTFGWQR